MASHDHAAHGHQHAPPADMGAAFAIGIGLNTLFVAAEVAAGLMSGSLALLADAGHNLSDVLALGLAWGASVLARRAPTGRRTCGYRMATILASLANAVVLLLAVGAIASEAIHRFGAPAPVATNIVMLTAGLGVLINGLTAMLFLRGQGDLNVRGAFLHMASDAAVSAAVVIAGFLILRTGLTWIDPVISLVVAAVILWGTWGLLAESTAMTLAGTPKTIEPDQVSRALEKLPGVIGTHHLHIWSLSTTETALTVHLQVDMACDRDLILRQANAYVHQMFGIDHSTIQVELSAPAAATEDCHGDDCGHH